MKKVYLVRHGETSYNRDHLVQDGSTSLTELGHKQAELVAERLQSVDFSHLIVSDYERTKQTALPTMEKKSIEVVYSPLFREVRRPSRFFHTSRKTDEYQNFMKLEFENFASNPEWHDSDEENFVDASTRALKAIDFLKKLDGDVTVISHGHFIRHIVAQVATNLQLDGPTWQKMCRSFFAVNTGITTLEYSVSKDLWHILTFNDIAHFAE